MHRISLRLSLHLALRFSLRLISLRPSLHLSLRFSLRRPPRLPLLFSLPLSPRLHGRPLSV
jgi:hypothetical protein